MKELLFQILQAVIIAVIPIVSAYSIKWIKQAAEEAKASADSEKIQGYITEIANAISDAVAATSQTFVDELKKNGTFTMEAQKEAAQKALNACLASISPAATAFIQETYGDLTEYLSNKIEAEVRKQKLETPTMLALPVMESTEDTTAIAASTAAATAATIAQTAINQLDAELKLHEQD